MPVNQTDGIRSGRQPHQKRRDSKSIFHRFLILIVGILIVPMILAYSVVSSVLVENLHDEYNNLVRLSSHTSKSAIQDALSRIINASISVIGSARVREYLTSSREREDFLDIYSLAYSNMEMYLQNNNFITNIQIASLKEDKSMLVGTGSAYGFTEEEKLRMLDSNGAWFWSRQRNGKFAICRLIRDVEDNSDKIGFMKIILNEEALEKQFYTNDAKKEYQFVLLDKQDDQVVICTDEAAGALIQEVYDEQMDEIKTARNYVLQTEHRYIIFSRIGTRSLDLVTVAADQTLYYAVMKYGVILLLLLLFLLVALICAVIYRKSIALPLDTLSQSMKALNPDSGAPPQVVIEAKGEVRALVDSYNAMSARLDYLYDTNYKNELKLRDANLLILQSEINPHFLYNVLDSIRWMIEMGQNADASEMVQDLSTMFRQTLKFSDRSVISLSEELEHVKTYISIENYRFRNKINFQMNIQKGLADAQVVKFILQPLVENAVVHGISKSDTGYGTVLISVYSSREELIYDIRDDGRGADEARIAEILKHRLQKKNSLEGFALENIQSRLRLRYGEEYGITYRRREEGGSILTVRQPLICGKEERPDAETDDCG